MPEENTAVQECQRPELPHKVCAGVCSMYSFGDALLYQDVSSVNCTYVRFMVCIVFILLVCSSSIRGDVAVMFQVFLWGECMVDLVKSVSLTVQSVEMV